MFICNKCGTRIEGDKLPGGSFQFTETETIGIRLYEKISDYRYESFHVPNKKTVFYCSRKCAVDTIKSSVDVFLSEISPKNPVGRVDL